ncbi:hypothetical protein QLH48_05495 [Bacillus safensis]|uniref:hypothetical protein n=1 Tax=Bacillus TaxID=1386 RepID=UPI00046A6906|nr:MULTISPECIES: hypothetical protein [Bacillus]AYJ89676.1 hypothetical protein CS953_08080 [Bacillus safensis]KEP31368.1 hypothetical protein ER50_02690 [Bacillus safensis]MBZ9519459.1 hypothetical protein [Bacillus safensis]MCM3365238.1 hypothetical protein [Bacillus safensis]MDJ0289897.1 hypothetical protein [Bacillus safensis]
MLRWKTFRYSLLHVLIVFMLFSTSFFRKPNGGKWMLAFMVLIGIVSFSVEYMLNRKTSGQKQEARRVKYLYFIMLQIAMTLILFVCIQLVMNRSL